jgi:hypothetical protein
MTGLEGTREEQLEFLQKWRIKATIQAGTNPNWKGFDKIDRFNAEVRDWARAERVSLKHMFHNIDEERGLGYRSDKLCEKCGTNFKSWQPVRGE